MLRTSRSWKSEWDLMKLKSSLQELLLSFPDEDSANDTLALRLLRGSFTIKQHYLTSLELSPSSSSFWAFLFNYQQKLNFSIFQRLVEKPLHLLSCSLPSSSIPFQFFLVGIKPGMRRRGLILGMFWSKALPSLVKWNDHCTVKQMIPPVSALQLLYLALFILFIYFLDLCNPPNSCSPQSTSPPMLGEHPQNCCFAFSPSQKGLYFLALTLSKSKKSARINSLDFE